MARDEEATPPGADKAGWLESWEEQQEGYLPEREDRFRAMFDAVEELLGGEFAALDLASGPGSLSRRLLERFPGARCVALDYDPVLLDLGRGALGAYDGRLRWVEANLRDPGWSERVGEGAFDAALSTTALHWLPAPDLVRFYSELAGIVKPGGAFLNGDHLAYPRHLQTISRVAQGMREKRSARAFSLSGAPNWADWWEAISREPGARELLAERERRFRGRAQDDETPADTFHEAALYEAGFSEVASIWQWGNNRVLLAIR